MLVAQQRAGSLLVVGDEGSEGDEGLVAVGPFDGERVVARGGEREGKNALGGGRRASDARVFVDARGAATGFAQRLG